MRVRTTLVAVLLILGVVLSEVAPFLPPVAHASGTPLVSTSRSPTEADLVPAPARAASVHAQTLNLQLAGSPARETLRIKPYFGSTNARGGNSGSAVLHNVGGGATYKRAVARLRSSTTGSTVFNFDGTHPWFDTGLDLAAGQAVAITARGIIYIYNGCCPQSPAGDGTPAPPSDQYGSFPAPGLSKYSLIANIDGRAPFEIGPRRLFIAPRAGRLSLGINDEVTGDNGGNWTITVKTGTTGPGDHESGTPSGNLPACSQGDPVNCATGGFSHSFDDLSIPGHGLSLHFAHTYDALNSAQDGPLGYGWTDPYYMVLTTDASGSITVTEEGGTSVTFTSSGGLSYAPPSRVLATLVKNSDGTFTFLRRDQTHYTFTVPTASTPGKLIAEADRNGYVTTLAYVEDKLSSVTDSDGRALTFSYNGEHIASVRDPVGRTVAFTYNVAGELTDARDVMGGVTHFTYSLDGRHLLQSMTDPQGGTVTNAYNNLGRVTAQTDAMGRTTAFGYAVNDDGTQTTVITDARGTVTSELYASNVLLARTVGLSTPQQATWVYGYDPTTLSLALVMDPNGHVTTMTYDASGNLLSRADPLGRTTSYAYDALNDTTAITDPVGNVTDMTYDAHGDLLSTSRPLIAMSANNGTITMTSTRRSAVVAAACQGSAATSPCGAGVQGLAACAGRCTPTTGATGERGRPAGRDVVRTFSVPPGQSVLGLLDGPASRGARTPTPVPSRARSGSRKAGTTHSTPSCSTSRTRCATATPRRPVPPSAGSRRRDTVISIDDNAQGSGIDRFRYVGLWGHCKPCRDGARIGMYDRSSSFSRRAGDYYTLRFRGVGIALYSVHGPTHGIEEVILDGHSRTLIDLYNRRRQGDVLDHRYAHLADGIHVLTVHVTGRKNRKSGNVYVVADRIAITQAGIIPPRQTPTPPPATATRVVTRIPTSKPTTAPRSTSTPSPTVTRPIATAIVGSTTANPAPPAPTATATPMPTAAPTMVLPTATRAPAPTETPTATPALPTNTTTATPGATATATMIPTTSTPTATATAVPPSGTATGTPEADATQPASTVSAATGTPTLAAATTAPADTATATASPTTTSTQTSVPSPTVPPTATPTPLPSIPCADAGPYTATVCLTYDPAHPGDVIARTDPDGHTSYYTYDQYGDRTSASDPLGDTTTSTYDLIGRRTSVTRPLGNAAGVNPINYTTAMAYDAFGDTTAITDAQGNVTTYGYDQDQNLVTTTDALGRQTIDGYNLDNERTSVTRPDGVVLQTSYDDAGNVITTTDGLSQSTSFAYDALNRLISMTAPLGRTTVYTYDLAGKKTAMTDPLSQTTAYTYNEANEVVGVLRPDGKALTTGYDLDGRVASQMDGRGSTTSYGYDSLGRTVAVTDGLGRVTAYGYDLAGNRTALTDPMGRTTTSTYDAANRLASIAYSDGSTPAVQYSYDADGNRTAMGDGTGTTRYTYDTLNRATSIVDGSGQRMGYGYDGANEIITLTYPGRKQVARAYDTLGRVTSVSDWLGHTTAFGYDGNGNVVSEVYPNASSAVLSYNAASDLTGITDTVNGTARWTFGYDRNSLGQVSGVSDGIDGSAHTYGYDNTHRLTSDSGPGGTQGWAYDAADNLAAITTTVDARAFAYDQANELTVLIATTGAATVNVPYAYNADGDRTGQSNGEGGASAAFGWDQADRLVTATVGITMTASYAYDGDGLRQSKTVTATDGTTITAETWDTADGLPQLVQNGSMRYVMGPLGPIEQIDGGNTPTYYYQDQLGSTRGLVDGSGSTVGTYSYDPYGNVTGHTGVSTPLQYAGQYTEAETGLQYLRARYYDPVTAQFLSRDPLVVVTGQAYIYTGDSPLNAIDPTGLYRCYPLGPDPCDMIVDGLHQSLQVFQGGVDQTEENVGQGVQGAIRDPKGTTIRVLHAVSGTSATVATGTGSLALTCSVAAAAGVETGPFDISAIGCAAVSGTVATVATGVGATSDVGLALLGNGSSKDLAIDAIGLGTLGLAKYIAHGLEGLDADARIKALADVVANAHAVPTFLIPFLHANEGGSGCATK